MTKWGWYLEKKNKTSEVDYIFYSNSLFTIILFNIKDMVESGNFLLTVLNQFSYQKRHPLENLWIVSFQEGHYRWMVTTDEAKTDWYPHEPL